MKVEEALRMAIEYEKHVRDVYNDARARATEAVGKKIFKFLAQEEQQHVAYLEDRLREWSRDGRLKLAELATAVPPADMIKQGVTRIEAPLEKLDMRVEVDLLKRALEVEKRTKEFYEHMAADLDGDGRRLFQRFLEIEEGHLTIVQAEIDAVSGMGFWFDWQEFNLSA
ncbi:ferritin family protein [bacterium]|nr:ferritin family protein [candidate division CSSED10-310 bacterium]